MKFTADQEQTVTRGNWNYIANVGSGSITLQYAVSGIMHPVNTGSISAGVIAADGTDIINLPTCRLKAGLTGDATFEMVRV
jgi:hypothetical protein